mmetsp:Transcript_15046/g.17350  ORF Transcript_15046/g.17350 Transcript_15046/m.17350 type:complete len:184 (+) Transcript_15046:151-702(+)
MGSCVSLGSSEAEDTKGGKRSSFSVLGAELKTRRAQHKQQQEESLNGLVKTKHLLGISELSGLSESSRIRKQTHPPHESVSSSSGATTSSSSGATAIHGYILSAMVANQYQRRRMEEERDYVFKLREANDYLRGIAAYTSHHRNSLRRFSGSHRGGSGGSTPLLPATDDELPFFFPVLISYTS